MRVSNCGIFDFALQFEAKRLNAIFSHAWPHCGMTFLLD